MAPSKIITKGCKAISAEQLTPTGSGFEKAAKVGCRQLKNPHDLTPNELKKPGLVWGQRVLKGADWLQAVGSPLQDLGVTREWWKG